MKAISIEKLAEVLGAEKRGGGSFDAQVSGISIDSRTISKGECFFAIRGENFDGHDHVNSAFDNGAAYAVVGDGFEAKTKGAVLIVDDTVKALGELGRWYRNEMDFKVIGITGSAGKTTTREIIHHVLSRKQTCWQAPKSFNNQIGLPLTLLGADESREVVIAELGSSSPGEISHLTQIAGCDVAVVTNIYPAHLEGFGGIEAIIKEKVAICEGLREGGKFLINGDFAELVDHCGKQDRDFVTFGEGSNCDIRGGNAVLTAQGGEITIEGVTVSTRLAGRANLWNILAAWAVCKQFGVSIAEFGQAVETVTNIAMRLEVAQAGSMTIINDCYNANPASMDNALDFLSNMCSIQGKETSRSVFVCGSMAELGQDSEKLHFELGARAVKAGVNVLIATGPFAAAVVTGAKASGLEGFESYVFENTGELCDNLESLVRGDDIILVKGSRYGGLEEAVEKLKTTSPAVLRTAGPDKRNQN